MADRWLYAWALGSVSFGGASLLVPLYLVQLDASPVMLGVLASTAALAGVPGAVLFGRLADRRGHRRSLVLVTLAAVAVSLAVVPVLTDVVAVVVANAALWLFAGSISPVLTMLVVDDAPEATWSERIGRLNKYQGYGWAGGLVLGTVWPLAVAGLVGSGAVTRSLFWLLAACAGASTVVAARTLPSPGAEARRPSGRQARRIARLLSRSRRGVRGATFALSPNRLYWTLRDRNPLTLRRELTPTLSAYLAAAFLFFTGFAAFWAPLPLFLTTAGFDPGQVFSLYLVSSLASAVLYEGAGRVAARYDVRLLQSGALAVRAAAFAAVGLTTGLGAVSLAYGGAGLGFVAIGVTWAVVAVAGTAIVTRAAPPTVRGQVLGVHTALSALAGGVGGVLGGWAATFGYGVAFAVAAVLVLLGAAVVLSLRTISRRERPGEDASDRAGAAAAAQSGDGGVQSGDGGVQSGDGGVQSE
ncbi:MAG: MFS transporter [Haloferacaceae archaeon]